MSAADPDLVVGGVLAVRRFRVDERDRLRPLNDFAAVWRPGENTAECFLDDDDEKEKGHPAPAEDCSCGLYALADVADLPGGRLTGVVELSGRIEVGGRGYRAEHGRVVALAPPSTGRLSRDQHRAVVLGALLLALLLFGVSAWTLLEADALMTSAWGVAVLYAFPFFVAVALLATARSAAARVRQDRRAHAVLPQVASLYPDVRIYASEAAMLAAHPLTLLAPEESEHGTEPERGSEAFWKVDL